MLILQKSRFWHCIWFVGMVLLSAVCFLMWESERSDSGQWPGGSSPIGLMFGVIAGMIFFVEMLYWVQQRRFIRKYLWRLGIRTGKANRWLIVHIWLGIFTVPLVVMHTGLTLGGTLTATFVFLFGIVIISGLYGLWLQNWVPEQMRRDVPDETVSADIAGVVKRYCRDAEILVNSACGIGRKKVEQTEETVSRTGARRTWGNVSKLEELDRTEVALDSNRAESLRSAFDEEIRPFLFDGCRYKTNGRLASESGMQAFFYDLRCRLGPDAERIIEHLERWCQHRIQFERQIYWHRRCHRWRTVHLPFAFALIIILLVHIVTSLKYVSR